MILPWCFQSNWNAASADTEMTPHEQYEDILRFYSVVLFFYLLKLGVCGYCTCQLGVILSVHETPEWLLGPNDGLPFCDACSSSSLDQMMVLSGPVTNLIN